MHPTTAPITMANSTIRGRAKMPEADFCAVAVGVACEAPVTSGSVAPLPEATEAVWVPERSDELVVEGDETTVDMVVAAFFMTTHS